MTRQRQLESGEERRDGEATGSRRLRLCRFRRIISSERRRENQHSPAPECSSTSHQPAQLRESETERPFPTHAVLDFPPNRALQTDRTILPARVLPSYDVSAPPSQCTLYASADSRLSNSAGFDSLILASHPVQVQSWNQLPPLPSRELLSSRTPIIDSTRRSETRTKESESDERIKIKRTLLLCALVEQSRLISQRLVDLLNLP